MRHRSRNRAQRLRYAVDALPNRTKLAMLRGIDRNRIIVGAYADGKSGGICPMLAAHRNGGRTSLSSFARAWDAFTGARRPRLATRREVRALRSYLALSLLRDEQDETSVAELAKQIRSEREEIAKRSRDRRGAAPEPARRKPRIRRSPVAGDESRVRELRDRMRWAWLRPTRRYEDFRDLVAAAEEQLSEQRAADLLGDAPAERLRESSASAR